MSDELLLHETPIVRAFFLRLRCLLRGGHKYGEINRLYCDYYWNLDCICKHCRHLKWWTEPISEDEE